MKSTYGLVFWMALFFSSTALAANTSGGSKFEQGLKRNGWSLTSKNSTLRPGDIYNVATKTIWIRRKACFSVQPSSKPVAAKTYIKRTSAEAGGFWSGIRAKGKGSTYVAKSYLDPHVHWISTTDLRMSPECVDKLRRSPDRGDLVVVTNVMTAKYRSEQGKSRQALLRILTATAKLSSKKQQKSFSKEPVNIAFKRRSVITFMPFNPDTHGTLKLSTIYNGGKKCGGRIWVNREHVGYTQRGIPLPVRVRANTNHAIQGGCGKSKSDIVSVAVRPGQNIDYTLRMQKYTEAEMVAARTRYRNSKTLDTVGYIVASGLLGTSAYFYIDSRSKYSEASEVTSVNEADRYADLRSQGQAAGDRALIFGASGGVVLTSALTHALFSTAIKKAKYKKMRRTRKK